MRLLDGCRKLLFRFLRDDRLDVLTAEQKDKLGGGLLNLPTVDLNHLNFTPTGKLFQ